MEQSKIVDKVYDYVIDMIVSGLAEDGGRIRESEICDNLNVSRTPVREALRLLEAERWVQCIPHKGAYVYNIEDKEFANTLQLQVLLGPAALISAIDNLSADDIDSIRRNVLKMEYLLDDKSFELLCRFELANQNIIISNISNDLLKKVMQDISKTFLLYNPKRSYEKCKELILNWNELLFFVEKKDIFRASISIRKLMMAYKDYQKICDVQ